MSHKKQTFYIHFNFVLDGTERPLEDPGRRSSGSRGRPGVHLALLNLAFASINVPMQQKMVCCSKKIV
jgi:hypothetical protein